MSEKEPNEMTVKEETNEELPMKEKDDNYIWFEDDNTPLESEVYKNVYFKRLEIERGAKGKTDPETSGIKDI